MGLKIYRCHTGPASSLRHQNAIGPFSRAKKPQHIFSTSAAATLIHECEISATICNTTRSYSCSEKVDKINSSFGTRAGRAAEIWRFSANALETFTLKIQTPVTHVPINSTSEKVSLADANYDAALDGWSKS